jgi:tRNA threonylcarbamoyladenosine modification (KEOPS) complex  Pcc1 subunit
MDILASITVKDKDSEKLFQIFQPEISKKDRSGFDLKKEKDGLRFMIEAKDSVALRATLNSITKLLTVYEKVKGAV